MSKILDRIDRLASIESRTGTGLWLARLAFVFLVLMALAAPHSIAATQIAWLTGMFFWFVSLAVGAAQGRRVIDRVADRSYRRLCYLLWAFFAWSVVSSLVSYEPAVSLDRLRGVALFLIVFYVAGNVRSLRAASFLALALIVSTMVNVAWSPVERILGRGVEIHGLAPDSPLTKAILLEGDTLLFANKKKIRVPEDLVSEMEGGGAVQLVSYRPDFEFTVTVDAKDLLPGSTALEKLGVAGWKKSHNWRSKGFYSHYVFYAEMLQLVASLTLGLLVALAFGGRAKGKNLDPSFRVPLSPFLAVFLVLMCLALFLTVTRASQGAFVVSALVIVAFGAGRKWALAAFAVMIPMATAAVWFLQRSREVGFFDRTDDSTLYRFTMWRDGMRLWTDSPRNFIFGVGMDSIQRRWQQWDLFDRGFLPMGHFHSMAVQLLVERGLPALLLWLSVLVTYFSILISSIRNWKSENAAEIHGVLSFGILLGCLGGAIGFCVSGLVQYNLGSQVTAMLFYFLMGLGARVATLQERTV